MESSVQLSIIIPMFNVSSYFDTLKTNLQVIANCSDIEILLINDGSIDDTHSLAIALSKEWMNVLVWDKSNGGAASARNFGIYKATGKYLAFLDADDQMDFDEIGNLLTLAAEKDLDLCAFDLRYIDANGSKTGNGLLHPISYGTLNTGQHFLVQGYQPSSICVFLVKHAFIGAHRLFFCEGITHEDVELSFRWMLKAQKVWFTKNVIYYYYQNLGSVTNQLTAEKKKAYLLDEVTVAALMKAEEEQYTGQIKKVIQKNYNSVTWNLLYSIYKEPGQLDMLFVTEVLERLKASKLYPIKGPLKTKFQSALRIIMNIQPVWRQLILRKLS